MKSLRKTIKILDYLSNVKRTDVATEISKRLGYSKFIENRIKIEEIFI